MTHFARTLFFAVAALTLAGCGLMAPKISDYSQRSTVYGWLDIRDIDANRLHQVVLTQHRPATDEPYLYMGAEKLEGGYLIYTHIPENGAYKLEQLSGQRCLLFLCSNTIFTYDLGKQGDLATAVIERPGVYFLGNYKLAEVKTGWFEAGKFEMTASEEGPDETLLLQAVLEEAPADHPVIGQRIQAEMEQ